MPDYSDRLKQGALGELILDVRDVVIDDGISSLLNEIGNTKSLTLEGLTETQAQQLLKVLSQDNYSYFTTVLNLPHNLKNHRLQVEFDNLISNHQFIQNSKKFKAEASTHNRPEVNKIKRTLPKEHTAPKLEIVLYKAKTKTLTPDEEMAILAPQTTQTNRLTEKPIENTTPKAAKLKRRGVAELILTQILQHPSYAENKHEWEQLEDRDRAKGFRQNVSLSLKITSHKEHPLNILLEEQQELREKLAVWTNMLDLGVAQYDALLDVYGQYGASGLMQLFQVWEDLNTENTSRFKNMYDLSLRKMPTYVPFIEDDKLKNTLEKITRLGSEKYSWWKALIKNHYQEKKDDYDDLSELLYAFNEKTNRIDDMHLKFFQIDNIEYQGDGNLTTALDNIVSLLNKNKSQDDKRIQFECIYKILFAEQNLFYFIMPEMDRRHGEFKDFEELKTLKDPQIIKQTVYRYLATRKYRLPLADYAKYLDEILFDDPQDPISDEVKCKMAYLLAKTTSTNDEAGFNHQEMSAGWESFKTRVISLESLERIKANRSPLIRSAMEFAISTSGGNNGARLEAIKPIIVMNSIPSISFLNKILQASEYKFYDSKLNVTDLISVQNEMMSKITEAATLYALCPENMTQAIRFIKTEVAPCINGVYTPEAKDLPLLEQFITAAQKLTHKSYNTNTSRPELNPQNVLLPLLTVFHLEYLEPQDLQICIDNYNQQINLPDGSIHQDQIQTLVPYALSLFQLVKDREVPQPLNKETLEDIQKKLIALITEDKITNKQEIRSWISTHYNAYFELNQLEDITDIVNIDAQLDEHGITNQETREAINEILSKFNLSDEEKGQQKDLVMQLISFDKTLTPNETKRFYDYCHHALKTNGLLARNKHDTPPGYLKQFQSLVQRLTEKKSIEIFEQFMEVTRARVIEKSADSNNSLAKCNYLITTLFPALRAQGVSPKEAFQFASELVCSTPQDLLKNPLQGIKTTTSEQLKTQQIIAIQEKIEQLHKKIEFMHTINEISPKEIDELRIELEGIIESLPRNTDLFQTCQKVIDTMIQIQAENQTYYNELNKKNIFGKIYFVFSQINVNPTAENRLWEAGLFELTEAHGPLAADVAEAVHRQGVPFESIVIDLHHKKVELIKKYESLTTRANDFINKALRIAPGIPHRNHHEFIALMDQLIALDDQNLVLSLMYHYNGGQDARRVEDLSELLSAKEFQALAKQTQKHVVHALVTQLNNHFDCSKDAIRTFIQFVSTHQNDELVLKYLDKYYQHAPFPSLSTFCEWTQPPINEQELKEKYAFFDKNPCATEEHNGREINNGFKRDKAREQLKLIPGLERIFTEQYLDQIVTAEKTARTLSTEELLAKLKTFKHTPPNNHIVLAMYTIEFLHRCKGRKPLQQIPGRSYELNTTQIISILALLETGKKVTAEIGTGEGKSRIMMVENACQFLKGNTPDFITSDLALAERDYLEALPFYSSLDAKVNLITAVSKIDEYHMDGINVSDPENINLFRNDAFSKNKSHLVLNPDPTRRALVLDEADVTYFDISNTQYNFSSEIPQRSIDILPLYPILMDFFAESGTETLYQEDKIKCNQSLLDRIETKDPQLFALIKDATPIELDEWQNAAYKTRHLVYDVDYTIVTDAKRPTALGETTIAAAKYLIGSRISDHAEGAEHIEQCLHAELNRLMKVPDTDNLRRRQALNACEELNLSFHITPKRKTTYTTSANSMLNDYKEGHVCAVTGTLGTSLEQLEARENFGTEFLKIPRHNGVKRVDRPTLIAENEDRHLDALVAHILESRDKGQPILIGCKDDNESQKFYDKLNMRLKDHIQDGLPNLTRIDAENYRDGNTPIAKFLQDQGGMPGQVIITTEILGRGIEYPLRDKALESGLKVLLTYLPQGARGYGQFIGRSGRYGQIGESQMVLNLQSLKQEFGINYRNRNFYANPEAFIARIQLFATYTKILHRLFNRAFDDLLGGYTEEYNKLTLNEDVRSDEWSNFLNQYRHSQERAQATILNQLGEKSPDIALIQKTLMTHQNEVKNHWEQLLNHLGVEENPDTQRTHEIKKPAMLESWLHTMNELQQKDQKSAAYTEAQEVKVHAVYERAHAGRMGIFKDTKNLHRWRDNYNAWRHAEGLLFPNFYAWRTGQLSTRNYLSQLPLLNVFITPVSETRQIKLEITSTYAALMQRIPQEEVDHSIEEKVENKLDKEDVELKTPSVVEETAAENAESLEHKHSI